MEGLIFVILRYFCMLTVSSDFSIQERHWQPLSVHLWTYCSPPIAHDMNDVWCVKGRPHYQGNFPYSFRTVTSPSIWLLKEGWGRQGQRLNFTTHWRDHLNWDKVSNHSQHDLTKDPGCWSGRGLNPWPSARQTGALLTEQPGGINCRCHFYNDHICILN